MLAADSDAATPNARRAALDDDAAPRADAARAINTPGANKGVGVRCGIGKQE